MPKLKNRLIYIKTLLVIYILAASGSVADTILPQSGIISDVSSNIELSIENSQAVIELSYIYIPKNLLPDAVARVKELALNKEYSFNYASIKANRYGNWAAVVTPEGGKSLQESLLEDGLTYAYFIDGDVNAGKFLKAEQKARNAGKGLWQDSKVIGSNTITNDYQDRLGEFIIIEGTVKGTYTSKKNTFINFGEDWKADFSVELENKILKKYPDFSAEDLTGKKLRVRGWLENYNGPLIKVQNPANIEIIGG